MSHVSASIRWGESWFSHKTMCLRSSFRRRTSCRCSLSEPSVLECLEVELCGAMRSRMRLHKFLHRRQLIYCTPSGIKWQIKHRAADESIIVAHGCLVHPFRLCPLKLTEQAQKREKRKKNVTVTGGVCLFPCESGVIERITMKSRHRVCLGILNHSTHDFKWLNSQRW